MNRRTLLATSCVSPFFGGCLSGLNGTTENGVTDDPNDGPENECEQFDGLFGRMLLTVPRETPDESRLIEIGETGLLSNDRIASMMEGASEEYADLREDSEDQSLGHELLGWVDIDNGNPYDSITESLDEFEPVETVGEIGAVGSIVQLIERWYIQYETKVYQLTFQHSLFPQVGPPSGSSLEVSALDSPRDNMKVTNAEDELIEAYEYFREVLEIARCSRESSGVIDQDMEINLEFTIGREEVHHLTDIIDVNETTNLLVEYEGEHYLFELSLSAD